MNIVFKRSVARALVLVLAVALWPAFLQADSTAGDYQAPDFDAELFDRDALSLDGEELVDVMDALTAVVRNFNSVASIDSDVKEKALALALRLQPLNPAARSAHQLMSGGEGPSVGLESILSYSDTAKIFHVLAVLGERLLRERAQPDDEILGPLLMEIGLTILSPQEWEDPEMQKLAHAFREVGGKGELEGFWRLTVRLQPIPGDGASLLASRLANLKPLVEPAAAASAVTTSMVAPAGTTDAGAKRGTTQSLEHGDDNDDGSQILEVNLMFFADVLGSGEPALANAFLKIEDADSGDLADASSGARLKLAKTGPVNSALRGVSVGESWVRKSFPLWPTDKQPVAVLQLGEEDKEAVARAPGERWPVEVGLPVAMVLDAFFADKRFEDDVAISGRLEIGGAIRSTLLRSKILHEVGDHLDRISILAIPQEEELVRSDGVSPEEIESLSRVQVFEVSTFEELQEIVVPTLRPPALAAAIARFGEVQKIASQGSILDNSGVREHLLATLELWPKHVSAQKLVRAFESGTGAAALR